MSNNLIYQYYITNGKIPLYVEYSWRSFHRYCDLHGIDHQFDADRYFTSPHQISAPHSVYFDILRLIYDPYFDQYDYITFVDCDVVVDLKAPNIFDQYQPQYFAGWTEKIIPEAVCGPPYLFETDQPKVIQSKQQLRKIWDCNGAPWNVDHGVQGAALAPRVINTGVVMMSREGRHRARQCFEDWTVWANQDPDQFRPWLLNDQVFISCMLSKYNIPCDELANEWNCTPSWFPHCEQHRRTLYHKVPNPTWFFHLSGGDKRDIPALYETLYGDTL
jgi:hypothetical protein